MPKTVLDQRCINTLRVLAMDAVQQTHSGHPGMPLGITEVAYTLWMRHLRHNPRNPRWPNRDRFVLSAGHGAILLYSLLHLTGYPLTLKDLRTFRQFGSRAPGHPEYDLDLGIEATTGPPGQGFANSVGMAAAHQHLAAEFNRPDFRLVHHFIYTIVSAGDLMEGLSHEAASLAGHWGLDKLICFYDANGISLEGRTQMTCTEDTSAHFRAYNWHIQDIDGHNLDAINVAIRAAKRHPSQPHLIICRTHIADSDLALADRADAHGQPFGPEAIQQAKAALDWPSPEPFFTPADVVAHYRLAVPQGEQAEARWRNLLTEYGQAFPELLQAFHQRNAGMLPGGWNTQLPHYRPDTPPLATRAASGQILAAIAPAIPELMGGAADLAPSTKTTLPNSGDFQKATPAGRNLHFGVREHALGGILNGMALHGGLRVYGGTFLTFSDYMRPAVRMAAMMKLPVTFVWTHDSFYVGEDGPTHQPVEQLMALRNIPNLLVIRPADANETVAAWHIALSQRNTPVALILTRQALPVLAETAHKARESVTRGAYVIRDSPLDRVDLLLLATGSEVHDALQAQALLHAQRIGARVVSMPCWRLFDQQPLFYKLSVLPSNVTKRLAVEAGSTLGWERYVGSYGAIIGIDHFGASGPAADLKEAFGFTPEAIAKRALQLMSA